MILPLIAAALLLAGQAAQDTTKVPVDVQFMRGMMMHHNQALEMAAMVPARSKSLALRTLAQRIDISQREEMQRMRVWLKARGDSTPTAEHQHMTHTGAGVLMPGMLTPAQMDSLRNLHGRKFEQRFLQYMIKHHEGALSMVANLLGTPGAVRDPLLFQLANSIDADQRAEISRMSSMLSTPSQRTR